MTSAAAVIGLTFDGTDIQQEPWGIFLELTRGLAEPPGVRGVDVVVPGLAGRIVRNRVADSWRIELHGYVAGIGTTEADARANFAALRDQMRTLFDPTAAPADLIASLEDGGTMSITARTLPTTIWERIVPSFARVSIELEAVEDWVLGGS